MYIDKMSKKEKIEFLKSEINKAPEIELDDLLLDFGYEFSDEEEEE